MERIKTDLTLRKIAVLGFLFALGLPAALSLLTGCEETPSEPVFENPFDPLGPYGGDPLQASAEATNDTTVTIGWNQPQDLGITRYVISQSAYRDSLYSEIGEADHTSNPTGSFPWHDAASTSDLWYMVQAFTATNFSLTSYATPAAVTPGPRVIVGTGEGTSASRFVNLEITVTEGDQLRIALDPTFTDSLRIVPAGAPGEAIDLTYDIGPAGGNNQIKTLYVASFGDGFESAPSVQTIRVDFTPNFTVVDDPPTLAARTVDLAIPIDGVRNMRFFAEWADTLTTPWVPVDPLYTGYQLSDSANPQFIRGQFEGDFGFNNLQEITVTPDLLTNVTFKLAWPDSDAVVDESTVLGISRAVATEMRYAESPDFTNAPWIAYADTVQIALSPTPGLKVVYVQYRNDWTMSGTLTDYVVHVIQPAEINFWAPTEGDVILGGTVFQVRGGTVIGSDLESVFLVEFDGGDGNGFVNADGTETWSYLWTVPRFTADTPLVIRAQAWYGPRPDSLETVTTAITVTVTQLAVAITEPLDGADLTNNRTINFSGTAAGVLGGTPLDLVTLDIGDEHIEASSTDNWSVAWDAPLWDADTTLTVVATAWAAADTAQHVIEVNVNRPPVTFTEPRDEDLVDDDTDLPLAGVTFSDLFSGPVESVVLDISYGEDTEQVTATGTDSWSATWHTPIVDANTQVEITATATAGTETQSETITVTVTP